MRRSRYTAVMQDGTQKVILAYDASSVWVHYRQRGYSVANVVKGDLRFTAKPGAGWTLSHAALARACKQLGITRPVYVRTNGKAGGTRGTYRAKDVLHAPKSFHPVASRDFYHHIVVKSYLTPEEATSVLWHELTHAAQAERAGSLVAWEAFSARQKRAYSYARRPIEVEARKVAKENSHISLTR